MKLHNRHISYRTIVRLLLEDPLAKWTKPAAEFLADWYTEQENDWGIESNFDRVAIRCDWCEYENLEEVRNSYKIVATEDLNNFEFLEYLHDETTVFELENGHYIIQNF
jgi:hypothetical protein